MSDSSKKVNKDELSIDDILKNINAWFYLLISKWKILVICSLFGFVFGLLYSYNQKTKYHAVLTYLMEDEKSTSNNNLGFGILTNQFGMNSPNSGQVGVFSSTYLQEFMKSRALFQKLLLSPVKVEGKIISIAEFYIQINSLRQEFNKTTKQKKIEFPPSYDIEKLSKDQIIILNQIRIDLISENKLEFGSKDKKSTIPQIIVTSENEFFAKIFCENLIKITSDLYIETKTQKTKKTVDILQNQLDSVRKEYYGSLYDFNKATDDIFNLNPSLKVKGISPTSKQINVQINSTLLSSIITNLETAKSTLRNQTPLFQIIDTPIYPLPEEKPDKSKFILLSIIISLLTCSIIIILFDLKQIKIK